MKTMTFREKVECGALYTAMIVGLLTYCFGVATLKVTANKVIDAAAEAAVRKIFK